MTSSPHFTNICTFPLQSDLFCQSLHPTQPLLAVGLASGHVHTYRLPSTEEDQETENISPPPTYTNGHTPPTASILSTRRRSSTASENGLGSIDTLWRTRRHKGSCRSIAYSNDGKHCYSAGTDGLVKVFESESGKVVAKIAVPVPVATTGQTSKATHSAADINANVDAPTALHELTPLHLVVATDSGALYVYDVKDMQEGDHDTGRKPAKRQKTHQHLATAETISQETFSIASRPSRIEHPHRDEHVNALVPLPPSESSTSGYPKQFVSVGGSTLAVTDVHRKKEGGVIAVSEDQEVELASCLVVSGLKKGGTSVGEKILVGQGDGVLSLWERGAWDDLDERIVVDRDGASIDALCEVPRDFLPRRGAGKLKMNEKVVACGLDDGRIRFVRIGRNGVLPEWDLRHDEVDGVVSLLFDTKGNRLVCGGGQTVKIWTKAQIAEGAQSHSEPQSQEQEQKLQPQQNGTRKTDVDDSDEEEDESAEEGDSDDEEEGIQYGDSDEDSEDSDTEEASHGKRKKRKRNKGKSDASGRALNLSGIF